MPQGTPRSASALERNCEYRASSPEEDFGRATAEESEGPLLLVWRLNSLKPYRWVLEIPFVAREEPLETREQPGDSPHWAEDLFHCGILREIPLSTPGPEMVLDTL